MNEKLTAEERIHGFEKFGVKLGLERMQNLCSHLGDPQDKLKVIHVAGTNGKGSVCRYIYEVLRANGYRCGIYSSPYVSDFRERIEADGEMISKEALDLHTDKAIAAVDDIISEGGETPTEFEVLTAIAFDYFAACELDFVVLEVGLGGSGDSTNVVRKPLASVITSISMDHMDVLGDTIEKIAAEKAGIIKPEIPVIAAVRGNAAKVIARKAYELKAPLIDATRIIDEVRGATVLDGFTQAFSVSIAGVRYDGMELSMIGTHQIDNAVCALTVIENLRNQKLIKLTPEKVKQGMKNAKLPGRFEVLDEEIPIILDGAHNADGAKSLAAAVDSILPERKIVSIVAILSDKDYGSMLRDISSFSDYMVLTNAPNGRTLTAPELKAALMKADTAREEGTVSLEEIPENALSKALKLAEEKGADAIVVCGSLYLIGDIRNLIINNRSENGLESN